jgi:hypothetical protein
VKADHAPALLLLLTGLVFLPILGAGFVWDDATLIVDNPHTASLSAALRSFGGDLWAGLGEADDASSYYRPLLTLDLALDRALFGLSPAWHHARSLGWHLLAVGGLLGLLRRLGVGPMAAAAAASLLALHPAGAEAVAFAAARNDPMAVALLLWGWCLLYEGGRGAIIGGLLALGAALTKESVLLLAPAGLLIGGAPGRRIAGATLLGALVALGLRGLAGVPLSTGVGLDAALSVAAPAGAAFLRDLVVPIGLVAPGTLLGVEPSPGLGWWLVGLGLLALGHDPRSRAGLAFAILTAGPALLAVARYGAASHRYLYAPLAGLALAAAPWLAAHPRRSLVGLGLMGLLGVGALSPGLGRWSDDLTFWTAMSEAHPSSYAFAGLGRTRADLGDLPGAAAAWDEAITASDPIPAACYNVAAAHIRLGEPLRAAELGLLALSRGCARSPELLAPTALGLALGGRWDEALSLANEVERDPTGKAVLVRLAGAVRAGDTDPLRQMAAASPEGGRLIEMVAALLDAAGEAEAARWARDLPG